MAYFAIININVMKSILAILLSLVSIGVFAQGQSKAPAAGSAKAADCYHEWDALFHERGAKPIANGTHDVVISVRSGNYSECFMGKVNVLDKRIAGRPQVQKVDGTYEDWGLEVSNKYFNSDGTRVPEANALLTISNGMSGEMELADGDIVTVFFYQAINEKPKANKKAPSPSALIKN
jgi:hypothetical protein